MAAQKTAVPSLNWPVDEDGKPLTLISFASAELVPTGNYANVTVGPASATKFVKNGDQKELAKSISELAEPVEWALAHRRDQILKELSEG
jgi:hypothetical protein